MSNSNKFFVNKLHEFIDENKEAYFSLKCYKENVGFLFYDTCKMIFDLEVPLQNVLLNCFSTNDYICCVLRLCGYFMNTPVFIFKTHKNNYDKLESNLRSRFISHLFEMLLPCTFENKKVTDKKPFI